MLNVRTNFSLGRKRNKEAVKEAIHTSLKVVMKEAAIEYVRVTAPLVHVDTGMSRGSLLPLSQLIGIDSEIRGTIFPVVPFRKGSWDMQGRYFPHINRELSLGEASSKQGKDFSVNYGTTSRPILNFYFKINVYQWSRNEDKWNSIPAGEIALKNYLSDNWASAVSKALKESLFI